jgi:DNA-binding transcriptional LysR family regulator
LARGFSIARPKVSLTEVGKAYYDRCTQIVSDLEQADEFAGALQSTPRGTLRIYGYPYRPVYRTGSCRIPGVLPPTPRSI